VDPRAWIATVVRAIARRPTLALAGLLLLIIGVWAAAVVRGTRPFDNGLRIWFLEGSDELRRLDEFHAAFGNDEVLVLAWREEGPVTTPAGLALVADVSSRVAAQRGVESVTSLATVLWTGTEGAGRDAAVLCERLFPPRPTEEDAARARDRLERMPLLKELLLSKDGRTTLVQIAPSRTEDLDQLRGPLLAAVKAEADAAFRAAGREPTWLWGGAGVLNEALNQASQRDSGVFTLASLVVIVVSPPASR
jgi:predicted RND superfamily exporter protein